MILSKFRIYLHNKPTGIHVVAVDAFEAIEIASIRYKTNPMFIRVEEI